MAKSSPTRLRMDRLAARTRQKRQWRASEPGQVGLATLGSVMSGDIPDHIGWRPHP
jgi:hypothetical protein